MLKMWDSFLETPLKYLINQMPGMNGTWSPMKSASYITPLVHYT